MVLKLYTSMTSINASSNNFTIQSLSSIVVGDIVINKYNSSDVWGVIVNVEPENKYPRVVFLSGGRIAKFSTYNKKWVAYSPLAYAMFMTNKDRLWKEIAKANSEDEVDYTHSCKADSYEMRLFLLTLHKDVKIETEDDYEFHIVRSMVVAAHTPELAKSIACVHDQLNDSKHAWNEPRNILCKTIGHALVNEMQIITVSREDMNA